MITSPNDYLALKEIPAIITHPLMEALGTVDAVIDMERFL